MDTLQVALSWLENGWTILPIAYRSKRPDFRALRDTGYVDAEGRPVWDPLKESPPSIEAVKAWFSRPCNLGVITGWRNLVVVDFDHREAYDAWIVWCRAEGGIAADIAARTYRVVSARGMHMYLIVEESIESWSIPGMLDVKGQWGYVLAPPSTHPSGHIYAGLGVAIERVPRLRDVLPFDPAAEVEAKTIVPVAYTDAWEAADRAVECGGQGSVAAIKAALSPENIVSPVSQDRHGSWARCPFHSDWNPSLRLYSDGHWHCFQCDTHGGDAIDLYAAMNNLTNREAISMLRTVS